MNKLFKGVLVVMLLSAGIEANAQSSAERASNGIGMAIIGMAAIFVGLILFSLVFKVIANISIQLTKRNAMKVQGITDKKEAQEKFIGSESGEVFAAISMALHEFQENVHDVEETVLTIEKVKRNYSPWSSKIYTLTETPRRR